MSLRSSAALGPILRLWVSSRALLGVAISTAWALGFAWIVFIVRFNSVNPRTSDDDWLPLLGATFVVGLPATFAILAGETVHELFRHTTTLLLPGIRLRLRRATLLMAGCITLLIAPAAALWTPTLDVLAAGALSMAGFAGGIWLMIRVRGGALWVLRIGSYLALLASAPALAQLLSGSAALCLAVAAASVVLIMRRFHPELVVACRTANVPTIFSVFGSKQPFHVPQGRTPNANTELYPRNRTGGDLAGWQSARDFEQLTMAGSSQAPGRMLRHTIATSIVALVCAAIVALIRDDLPAGGLLTGTLALLADLFVGLPDVMPAAERDVFRALMLLTGVTTAVQAILAARPLMGGMLYPMSRSMRARLALAAGRRLALAATGTTLWLGGLIAAGLWAVAGAPQLERMPLILSIAAVHLVVVPWSMALFLGSRRLAARGRPYLALLIGTAFPGIAVFLVIGLIELLPGPVSPLDWSLRVLGYAAFVAASFAGLRPFVNWHFASIDLTTR
jgi:hypothetical protein